MKDMGLEELLSKLKLDEEGRLVLGDVRMVLTTRDFIVNLQKVAEDVLGPMGAATLLYRAGFLSGYHFAEAQARLFGLKGLDILDKYLELASLRGWWGGYEVIERSQEPLKVVVRFYHTIAEEWGNVGRAVCHLWRGGLAGILKYVADSLGLEVEVRVQETACMAKGDPYCE
ncbi:hypothetical protein DRO32_05130, partial [Candidatus Bathyarchaeota archaeon]